MSNGRPGIFFPNRRSFIPSSPRKVKRKSGPGRPGPIGELEVPRGRDQPFFLASPPDRDDEPEERDGPELDRPEEPERPEDDPPDLTEPEGRDEPELDRPEEPLERGALKERPEEERLDLGALKDRPEEDEEEGRFERGAL